MNKLLIKMYEENLKEIKYGKEVLIPNDLPFLVTDKGVMYLKNNYVIGVLKVLKSIAFLTNANLDFPVDLEDIGDAMDGDLVVIKFGYDPTVVYVIRRALKQIIVE